MNTEHEEITDRLWNRNYIFVLLINTLNAFSFYMTATILLKYLVGMGIVLTTASMIVGLFSITSLCVRPFCGILSDRTNIVKLLIVSNVFLGVGILGMAYITSVPLLVLFRIINGIGFSLGGTAQVALAAKYIPMNRTGEGIGYIGLGQVLGSAVAPGIGIAIADRFGMKFAFVASVLLTVVAIALLLTFKSEPNVTDRKEIKVCFSDIFAIKAIPFAITGGAFSLINGIIASYLVLFADGLGVAGISVYFTVYAVCLFVIRPLSGKVMDRYSLGVVVFPGILVTVASMMLLSQCSTLSGILLSAVLRAIGQGAAQPSLQAACLDYVGRDKSGVATSSYYLGCDVSQGIGPTLGGFLLTSIVGLQGYRVLFLCCAGFLILICIYFGIEYCTRISSRLNTIKHNQI